jgi:hypothetical protein
MVSEAMNTQNIDTNLFPSEMPALMPAVVGMPGTEEFPHPFFIFGDEDEDTDEEDNFDDMEDGFNDDFDDDEDDDFDDDDDDDFEDEEDDDYDYDEDSEYDYDDE